MNCWEEKKKIALAVSIDVIMESEGFVPHGKSFSCSTKYLSPFREEQEPSFVVYHKENRWVDYGLKEKHIRGDGINLIMKLKGYDFKQAVNYLVELSGRPLIYHNTYLSHPRGVIYPEVNCLQRIDYVHEISSAALVEYLQNIRRLPIEIVRKWCKEVHYTYLPTGRHYFGIGMMNNAGGWVVRSAPYSGCINGKKLDIAPSGITCLRRNDGVVRPEAYVFEGFLNYLSWVVLYGDPDKDVIILNSANNAYRLQGLSLQGTKVLVCYLDNDIRGRQAYEDITKISGCQMQDMSEIYSREGLSDLNDYLKIRR